jgi:hypothetical protein
MPFLILAGIQHGDGQDVDDTEGRAKLVDCETKAEESQREAAATGTVSKRHGGVIVFR